MSIAQSIGEKTTRKDRDIFLVNQIRNGNKEDQREAYSILYNHYAASLRWVFKRKGVKETIDIEDLAIHTLSNAFTKLDTFNDDFAFSTWIHSIANNILIDHMRKNGKMEVKTLTDLECEIGNGNVMAFEIKDKDFTPEEKAIRESNHNELHRYMKRIKPHYREVLNLFYFRGMSYEEMSKELNSPIGTIKAHVFRAKKELERMYRVL